MSHDPLNKSWLERLGHALSRPKNQEELLTWLQDAVEHHLIEREAFRMIEGVLQVYDMHVRDIMIPRSQMVVVPLDGSLEEILPIVISSAHSRFPVIKENRDEVVGILLAKDLLPFTSHKQPEGTFSINQLLRPATFIPESKRLNVLLEEFRITRNHMAIVVDEYGGISGVLTIEDVLELIVGEIEDEYDIDEGVNTITQVNETQYTLKALTRISDFNSFFQTQFSDEEFDTIGGLVTSFFGYLPKRNEFVMHDGIEFKVLYADKRRIRLLQVTLPHALNQDNK